MRRLLPLLFFVAACTSTQPEPPTVPDWDTIPAGVMSAFCHRLQMDGVGTNAHEIAMVKITQPLVTSGALARLGKPKRKVAIVHRALPIATSDSALSVCQWKPIDALDPNREFDTMVVELSAPVANPANPAAGMLARVTLGGAHPNWYWIELNPRGGAWSVGRIFPISL